MTRITSVQMFLPVSLAACPSLNSALGLCGRLWTNALLYSCPILSSIAGATLSESFYNTSLHFTLDLLWEIVDQRSLVQLRGLV